MTNDVHDANVSQIGDPTETAVHFFELVRVHITASLGVRLQITVNVEHLVEGSAAIEVAHHIAKSERCRVVLTAFAIELPLLDRLQGMLAVRHKDIGVAGQAEGILSE